MKPFIMKPSIRYATTRLCTPAALVVAALLLAPALHAQTIDGRFQTQINAGAGSGGLDQLAVTVQIMTQAGEANIGNSTLQFTYNNDVLAIPSAAAVNTHLTETTDYVYHTFSGASTDSDGSGYLSDMTRPQTNVLSVNIEFSAGFSGGDGQALTATWTDVVTVYLDITDATQTANLFWTLEEVFGPDGTTQYTNGTFTSSGETVLPVELISFEAQTDGSAVMLSWQTASETNNAGFEVEWAGGNSGVWTRLAFVEGASTTTEAQRYQYRAEGLEIGTYQFRLKQIDYDGTFEYSPEVEVTVELAERFVLEGAYPNPFNPQTTIRFAVQQARPVQVALYDALGRRVQVLYQGVPEAGQMQAVQIDGRGLSSGMYFVRLAGEGIVATRRVMLVK